MTDPLEHPEARKFLNRARRDLLPKIKDSALTVALWGGDPDPKQAIEFGYSVLLDKPIVLVVLRNAQVPEKVMKVTDAIIEWTDDQDVLAQRINEVMAELLGDDDA